MQLPRLPGFQYFHQASLDHRVNLVRKATLENPVQRANKARKVNKVQRGLKGPKVHRVTQESRAPRGEQGAEGPQGEQGPEGPQGPLGDKMAIVPWRDQFVGLFCVESPDVRFEDVFRVPITGETTTAPIDSVFLEVCEPGSVDIVGISSPIPTLVGAEIIGNQLHFRIAGDLPPYVTVKLSGIRQGRHGVRFPRHTRSEMEHNNRFWSQARRG